MTLDETFFNINEPQKREEDFQVPGSTVRGSNTNDLRVSYFVLVAWLDQEIFGSVATLDYHRELRAAFSAGDGDVDFYSDGDVDHDFSAWSVEKW